MIAQYVTCIHINLAVLVYLSLMQRGSLPLKVNVKIFQLGTTFFISGQIMRNFQILIITLLWFESESQSKNCNFVAEKLDFEYLLSTNPIGFFRCSPLLQRRLMGKCYSALSGSATGDLRPSEYSTWFVLLWCKIWHPILTTQQIFATRFSILVTRLQ